MSFEVFPEAIILDRDGVINKNRGGYVKSWEEFDFIPGIFDQLKLLTELGLKLIIVTNQSPVARGLISEETLDDIHRRMVTEINNHGGLILDVFYCPHHPEGAIDEYRVVCQCRKPGPGMLLQAIEKYNLDPLKVWAVGDREKDVEAGDNAGCGKTILLPRNKGLSPLIEKLRILDPSRFQ